MHFNINFADFVSMYVDHILNKSIAEQFAAFYEGFHSVCNSAALKVSGAHFIGFRPGAHDYYTQQLFRPEEVETLVCGCTELDVDQLELITEYEGYSSHDDTIRFVCCV